MAETASEGSELDLRDYVQVLWRRKWIILIATVVMTGAAYGVSVRQDPIYEASARFRVVAPVNQLVADSSRSRVSVETEIEVLKSAPVIGRVREKLGGIAPPVAADSVNGTEFVRVAAESRDPESAAAIANAYVSAYVEYRRQQIIDDLMRVRDQAQFRYDAIQAEIDELTSELADVSPLSQPQAYNDLIERRAQAQSRQLPIRAQLDDVNTSLNFVGVAADNSPAEPPSAPSKPMPVRNGLLALPVGLIFGIGLVFLFEYLDDSIKSKDDLQRASGGNLPVLGLIPAVAWRNRATAHVVALESPTSAPSEAYRALRTAVQFLGVDEPLHCLQVTSASAAEGKTTTVTNLAVVLARAEDRRVVVVDCDLRRPRLHEFLELPNEIGFTSVLLGEVPLSGALQPFPGEPGLSVLVSGPIPSDPSELLASRRTAEVFSSLRADGSVVLIDTPPVLPVTDALVVSKWVDATLLVTASGTTTRRQVQRALELLTQVEAPVVGSVLNKAPTAGTGYGYGDGVYYGSGSSLPAARPQAKTVSKAPVGR